MTKITFYKENEILVGFEVSGHTGKDDYGKDLLCCEISTIAQLALVGIDEIAKAKNFHEISDGYLKIKLNKQDAQNKEIQFLFKTCYESFKSVIQDEKKYAKMEVKNV